MAGYRARQVAVGLAAAATIAVYAQDEQPAPTFRSEINYVQLPVRVLDANGQFISSLTQSDFRILEDGKPQTITAFSAVDIPFIPADTTVPVAPLVGLDAVASNDVPRWMGEPICWFSMTTAPKPAIRSKCGNWCTASSMNA